MPTAISLRIALRWRLYMMVMFLPVALFSQSRDCDPVVLTASEIPCMLGVSPDSIVAFRYDPGLWVQIPMQIDQRVLLDVNQAYGPNSCFGSSTQPYTWDVRFYADTHTFIGADTNPLFDADDELVFMARDAGIQFVAGTCPPNVVNESLCEISVYDPVSNSILGYVYLYRQDGSLDPSAGQDYVSYQFSYDNTYTGTYDICNGGNPESSLVSTSSYAVGFSERWVEDELRITAGAANGVDILDRHQAFVFQNNCFRTEDTFSASNGAIVSYVDGPVRAIRSVMGSNSGTFNQNMMQFTECRADYFLFFRVHPIGGYYDVFDLSSAATGLSYYNDQNAFATTVDGIQDALTTSSPNLWDLYDGPQGAMIRSFAYDTDMSTGTIAQALGGAVEAGLEAYYDDAAGAAAHTCTGDGLSYGASGFHLLTAACTDRRHTDAGCDPPNVRYFETHNTHYYLPPGQGVAQAQQYDQFARQPLSTTTNSVPTACSILKSDLEGDSTVVDMGSAFRIMPNPLHAGQDLTVWVPQRLEGQRLVVMDLQNKVVFQAGLSAGSHQLSLSDLGPGLYIVYQGIGSRGKKLLVLP